MRRFGRIPAGVAVVVLAFLTGCSTSLIVDDEHRPVRNTHAPVDDPQYAAAAATNDCRIDELYGDELRAHDPSKQAFERGLALSGGGMRAATFAMGVLEALQKKDELPRVDVVSSVSGGGYTWGWYVSHVVNEDDPKKLFDIDGPYQQLIGKRANLTPKTISLGIAGSNLFPGALWNLFANGLFGWHANASPGRHFYEHRLRRTFNTEPVGPNDAVYINRTWADYRQAVKDGKIPTFILNAAVLLDDDPKHISGRMANLNYEFTPWHHGNDAYGYASGDPPFDLPRAISISGGALDLLNLTPGFSQKLFISAIDFDIGYSMNNPGYERPLRSAGGPAVRDVECGLRKVAVRGKSGEVTRWERFREMITPFPLYLGKPWYARHKGGSRLYLSDAGFSDNLGAYSLIRRMTRDIIIVDATQEDPAHGYDFGAYKTLQRAVHDEMDAVLSVPTIDAVVAHTADFDPRTPVMAGTVRSFPTARNPNPVTLNIIYVKLSMNPDISVYPDVLQTYYRDVGARRRFPYESTGDQQYDDVRFRAFRALGYTIGMCIPRFGSFSMKVDPPCYLNKQQESSPAP